MSERGGVSRGRALVTLSFKGESLWVVQDSSEVQLMLIMTHLSIAPWNSQPAVVEATAFRLVAELNKWLWTVWRSISFCTFQCLNTVNSFCQKK